MNGSLALKRMGKELSWLIMLDADKVPIAKTIHQMNNVQIIYKIMKPKYKSN